MIIKERPKEQVMKIYKKIGNKPLKEIHSRFDNPDIDRIIEGISDKGYLDEEDILVGIVDTKSILETGKYTVPEYLAALEFTRYRMAGDTQSAAYRKTFPERCVGKTDGAITGKASIYAHGKLVMKFMARAEVPLELLYMREVHQSIRKLSELVAHSDNERIQMESADKLLGHIMPKKDQTVVEDIGEGTAAVISEFTRALDNIANTAMGKLNSGDLDAKTLIQKQPSCQE